MTRRYPAYKDSGVEWLGEVPEGWALVCLKHACHVFPSNVDKHTVEGETPVLLCNYTDVYYNEVITSDLDFMAATAKPEEIEKFTLQVGDVVFTKDSETSDDIGIAALIAQELPGVVCGYHLSIARPYHNSHGPFIKRFFDSNSAKAHFQVSANGLTRVGLGQYVIDNLPLALPPLPEQTAIAAFLDRETAKIDALVAEQRQLIDLLREKRQAVISHAVTKGLNPNAPLKPSGIDWLGDVPEGWEVVRLRHVATLNPSKSEVGHLPGETEVSFLPMEAVGENGQLDLERTRPLSEVLNGYTYFAEDDVTYAKITPCFENGKGALMRGLLEGFGFGTTELTVLRPDQRRVVPEFLECVLSSPNFRLIGEGAMYGAGGQKRVPDDFARDFIIGLPSLEEQREIVAAIDEAKLQFETLTATAETAIALLQERRAALISAAVTGKIDVRENMTDEVAA